MFIDIICSNSLNFQMGKPNFTMRRGSLNSESLLYVREFTNSTETNSVSFSFPAGIKIFFGHLGYKGKKERRPPGKVRRLGSKDKITIPSLVWEVSALGYSATWHSAAVAVHKTRHPGRLRSKVGWGG